MTTILGHYNDSHSTELVTTGASYNQQAQAVTIPSAGTLTRLGALLGAFYNGTPPRLGLLRLCVWSAADNSLLAQSASFYAPSSGTPARCEADLSSPLAVSAGQTVLVGWCRENGALASTTYWASAPSGGSHYTDTGSWLPGSIAGKVLNDGYIAAYAYFTPTGAPPPAPPDKPTGEAYGVITTKTPTLRLHVTSPDGGAITALDFVVTRTSPAHAAATISAPGGPWASGSWVSLALSDIGLGYAAGWGDAYTYHGVAATTGGVTAGDEDGSFAINGSPDAPTCTTSGVQSSLTPTLSATFTDPDGDTLTHTRCQVASDSGFAAVVWDSGVVTCSVASGGSYGLAVGTSLTRGSTYWYRYLAVDGQSWGAWGTGSFSIDAAPSAALTTSGLQSAVRPDLSFTATDPEADSIASYQIQIAAANDSGFNSPVIDSEVSGPWASGSTITFAPGSDLTRGNAYIYRARVADAVGYGAWSASSGIQINASPNAPVCNTSGPQASVTPTLVATFSDPDGDPTVLIQCQVASDSGFASIVWDSGAVSHVVASGAQGSVVVGTSLAKGSTYWYRFSCTDGISGSGWGTGSFSIQQVACPDAPVTESYGVVVGLTPTIRCYVSTPDGAPITEFYFALHRSTGGYVYVNHGVTGGPWASGTWISYALNNADLGATVAPGDVWDYWGVASNGGGMRGGTGSVPFTINSATPPTITNPAAGPVIARPVLTGGSSPVVGCRVDWAFNDAQGEAQLAYQVKLYADDAGSKGAALSGADTGKVSSIGGRTADIAPTAGLTNKVYFWVGVTTWDVHDVASSEATVRTRMAWGRADGRIDCGATPTVWAIDHVWASTNPAVSEIVIEYASTTGGTGQTEWTANLSSVPLRRWFHWRVWLFGWGSASPTSPSLDELALQYTSTANVVPDEWDLSGAGGKAFLDTSTYRFGSKSLRFTCTGSGSWATADQRLDVRPFTDYVLAGYIRALVTAGSPEAYIEIGEEGAPVCATAAVTATTPDFVQVVSTPYRTGSETSMRYRVVVYDAAGASGSQFWFDCVQCSPGTVIPVWQPGNVGRGLAVDSGGIITDGQAGATVRHHGSGTAATDYVEMGVHGWKLGGGPEISGDGTYILIDGAAVNAAGKAALSGANMGPTLPAQPAYGTGVPFFYTAAGYNELVVYDGTRWLTGLKWLSLQAGRCNFPTIYSDIYLVRVEWAPYVATTNNGSNYQILTPTKYTPAVAGTSLGALNTSAGLADHFLLFNLDINAALGGVTNYPVLIAQPSVYGSPGAVTNEGINLVFRGIAT